MIKREHYIEKIRKFYDSDQIKMITGIKDSGKSVVLSQIMSEIKEKNDNIIYLNFADKRISANIKTSVALVDHVRSKAKRGKCYLFFDEIQMLNGWWNACAVLQKRGYSIFVIASDRDFWNEELEKELGGKYVSFRIRPFVYREMLEYADELGKNVSIDDYLAFGGFPKRLELDGDEIQRLYIDELDRDIIDGIIRRYKIRKEELFLSLVDFILRSNGMIFSEKAIYNHIIAEHGSCSINTIMKYLDYLKEAYVIEAVPQFSSRVERALVFYAKIYDADVALNSIRCLDGHIDMARNLENVVYNELVYRGYDVSGYDNGGKKIDFFARKDGEEYFINTVYGSEKSDGEILGAFGGLAPSSKKILITYGEERYVGGVTCVNLEEFLLMDTLEKLEFLTDTENFEKADKIRKNAARAKKDTRTENFVKSSDTATKKNAEKKKAIKAAEPKKEEVKKAEDKKPEDKKPEDKKPELKKKKVPFYQIF